MRVMRCPQRREGRRSAIQCSKCSWGASAAGLQRSGDVQTHDARRQYHIAGVRCVTHAASQERTPLGHIIGEDIERPGPGPCTDPHIQLGIRRKVLPRGSGSGPCILSPLGADVTRRSGDKPCGDANQRKVLLRTNIARPPTHKRKRETRQPVGPRGRGLREDRFVVVHPARERKSRQRTRRH